MKFPLIAAAALMAASVSAQAAQINYSLDSLAGATVIGFDSFDGLVNTTGTIDLGNGVVFSGGLDAELSPPVRDLGDNGAWTFGLNGFAASGTSGTMTFTFDALKAGASAFVSHLGGESLLIEALGLSGNVLENATVTFAASSMYSYDEGTYVGFLRNTTDIKSLRITGVGAVADNVTVAVPEPETYMLALVGLSVLLGARQQRRKQD
ncbi:PEP-CTERM sorting domain-containing protein [Aquabacterium sp.]|uniref:PEP-CTERM sorting domain-containing protein n=1 Tax=Aquabacterium sp. TaxID=1872578 RepID=UPI00403833F1